nr:Abi family protein [Endozoicomonas sp. SESOKO2]
MNYYRFRAYCLPYEEEHASHRLRAGTHFDDVLNLYIFDRELRLLVLDAIERLEVSLRTQFAYHLSHNHETDTHTSKRKFLTTQWYTPEA